MALPVSEAFPHCLPWHHGPAVDRWVQLGLAVTREQTRPVYPELAELVRGWLAAGVVEDFFFMHKPPGLRVRFAPAPGRASLVRAELRRRTGEWRAAGLLSGVEPGVYEPEEHLFGGPASMDHVHRLFTVDATTWLDFHAARRHAPAWALSLAMLRPVFDGLRIAGWEEQDVWGRVAGAGRRVPAGAERSDAAMAGLRHWWDHPAELLATLPDDVRAIAERHAVLVAPLARAWGAEYFRGEGAVSGPRQAAAYYVVFHWNRGALSFGRQALLTEALAVVDRLCGDVR